MVEPDFTEIFKVSNSSEHQYRGFINQLRNLSQDSITPSLKLPVLPAQQDSPTQQYQPTQCFDVVLYTARRSIRKLLRIRYRSVRLRIQRDNLYLLGYRDNADGGRWYEFRNKVERKKAERNKAETHMIPGSTFLGFEGNYTAMQTSAGRRREFIRLGQLQLVAAVDNLLGVKTTTSDIARALIVIIQMICESMRFAFISNAIAKNYTTSAGLYPISDQIIALEESWDVVSSAILSHERDPGSLQLDLPAPMGINNIAEAAHMIGIVLN